MDSDKTDEDEHEAISKQIVDYYRKYSQNKQLPKYFSGTSLSYMPQIVKDDEIVDKPLIIIEDTTIKPQCSLAIEEPKVISPASSVTSNRKLEWDNGADIGYSNCEKGVKLHKSISLPILTGSGDYKPRDKTAKSKLNSQVVTIISYSSPSDDNSVEKPIQSSSSSSSYPAEKPAAVSSSSSSQANPKPVSSSSSSSFTNTLAYLKSKIGTPDAESTPKVGIDYNTPCAPKAYKKREGKHRVIDLCITKPILVECVDGKIKKVLDKRIQTSLISGLSKCVQTGDSLEAISEEPVQIPKANQSVIVINYDSTSDKRSSNPQTSSDLGSQCDSFEYYQKQDVDKLKRSRAKSDLVASSDSSKSNEIPLLGQLISEQQSKSLVGDIDRSIEILQKLLKSRKYDAATKKRYIKKIVEKIVDNKYDGDSTTSSELFLPKKDQQKLQENVPWYPAKMSKFSVKTFSDEFLPNGDQSARKRSPFTMSEPRETPTSSLGQQNSSSGTYPSWKDDKTLSERLLEEKETGQGDHLVKFAMKERQHQIAWINDEISHLTKLKGLLEKDKVQRTTTVYMVSDVNKPSSCSSNSQRNSARNYVIQTEISPTTSSNTSGFNLHDQNGQKNYHIKEVVPKTEENKNGDRYVGDIEVVSDENSTNIKVKAHKLEPDKEIFKPKKPILVGGAKYDTFPRSHAEEERCWPCGIIRSRRGLDTQQYTDDVPKNTAYLLKKVDEIMSKYSSKASIDKCRCNEGCVCGKKDGETYRKSSKESTTSASKSSEDVEPKTVTRYVCTCQNKDSALQTECVCKENAKAQTEDCVCVNKQVQASIALSSSSSAESDSESTSKTGSSSTTGTVHSCLCCKRKNVKAKTLYALRKKLSDQAYPLCRPCYRQNQRRGYTHNIYCNPTHVCNCYTVVDTKTLNDIKETINDLKELDEEYCSCTGSKSRESSDYCRHCNCKLKKTSRNKNGIAYMLTFENQTVEKKREKEKQPYLEEIKIKIPTVHKNKKKHKDKVNKRKKESRSHSVDSEDSEVQKSNYNLQECLRQNRPDFVQVAEDRRKSVVDSRVQREETANHNKLQFLQNYMEKNTEKNSKRIFSAKEMKEITRRNYEKLPEVQRRLIDTREKQIRQASRLMADTFNRKLRENVLKGKRTLPTDVNLVNL